MSKSAHPLVVTSDLGLLDDVLRLAAAAGTEVETVSDVGAARSRWRMAPLVIIGSDVLLQITSFEAGFARREGVLIAVHGSPDPPLWRGAVEVGAERIMELPSDEADLVQRLSNVPAGSVQPGQLVSCLGAIGGCGATFLATALAATAASRRLPTLLIDADHLGGGIDIALGAENSPGLRWPELAHTSGRISAAALRNALPRIHGLAVLSASRNECFEPPGEAMRAVMSAAQQGGHFAVVDLPRCWHKSSLAALELSDVAFFIVPQTVRAVSAARQLVQTWPADLDRVRVIVRRHRSSPVSIADIADSLGVPVVGELTYAPRWAANLDRGDVVGGPSSTLGELCRSIVEDLVMPQVTVGAR